jgi:hypothetical protein
LVECDRREQRRTLKIRTSIVAMDSSSSATRMRFFSFVSDALEPDTLPRGSRPGPKIKGVGAAQPEIPI